jgi:hypothetical protein
LEPSGAQSGPVDTQRRAFLASRPGRQGYSAGRARALGASALGELGAGLHCVSCRHKSAVSANTQILFKLIPLHRTVPLEPGRRRAEACGGVRRRVEAEAGRRLLLISFFFFFNFLITKPQNLCLVAAAPA